VGSDPDQETLPVAIWSFHYNQADQLIEADGNLDYSDGTFGTTSKDGIYSQKIQELYSYVALGRLVRVTTTVRILADSRARLRRIRETG
jgi:hypothetical protein